MQLHFCEYESWMKDQVIDMFCAEYGNAKNQFTEYYDNFYSGYQQDKAIRLVILENKVVVGFVSFSYWPYRINNKLANSYQLGNVIINKDYRGKGIYNQLLNHLNENAHRYHVDFIIGFPIKQILKLYLKSNWKNPFNLNWYIKIINPFGWLFSVSETKLKNVFLTEKKHINTFENNNMILNVDENFYNWNRKYNNLSKHFYFEFSEGEQHIEFSLKINKRKYINELIIGEVNTNTKDFTFIKQAFRKLKQRAAKLYGVSILSICMNDCNRNNPVLLALTELRYKKINRDIKFIVNNFKMDESQLLAPENWELYRRDLDTW